MAGIAAGGGRRSPLAPYLLVAPGVLWLLAFYVVPTVTLARTSALTRPLSRSPVREGFHLHGSLGWSF